MSAEFLMWSDIEKTLNQLDHVIEFYHITEEVEPVIREG